jgi:hypothetical protein
MPTPSELPVPLFIYETCGSTYPYTREKKILLCSTSWLSGVETSCFVTTVVRFSQPATRKGRIRRFRPTYSRITQYDVVFTKHSICRQLFRWNNPNMNGHITCRVIYEHLYVQFSNEHTCAVFTTIMYGVLLVALELSLSMYRIKSDKRMWNRT